MYVSFRSPGTVLRKKGSELRFVLGKEFIDHPNSSQYYTSLIEILTQYLTHFLIMYSVNYCCFGIRSTNNNIFIAAKRSGDVPNVIIFCVLLQV